MNKKDLIKTLDIASFVSAAVATILVVIFEFSGNYLFMKYSIVLYAACFLTLTILQAISVYEIFNQKQTDETNNLIESEEHADNIDEVIEDSKINNQDEKSSKKNKIKSIIFLVLASLAFIFTCVLLVLY